ncbi:Hypothetical protein PENO1_024650 [Penicillium occitanis (nom. inval.)]|nr:hypothetical protein PENOC_035670 [Penicillium occitanis (nom. inval.)]PCH05019.1 Hypothetical protein PENO1_024650 [Penicillium occitanis (nom. inval.)]
METFAARLASFDSVVPAINSRTSSARNIQPQRWVWESPSPEQLAHAGFYFQPYDTNPDNTMCFLCGRALDGWEEGDDPVTEHLKHSPDCGWAIIMDIQSKTSNPAEIVDPTSSAIVEARRATFAVGWPHEGKRGWMVEAGWYFCPNEESPDLASCPYCKLSLDGWEEADDPFEEHHRRSSECSFFVFALPAKPTKKNTRAKKPRASKSSRLSTQSVMTAASEAPTIDDEMMDVSIMSQSTVRSQSTKKAKPTKKTTKSRAKKTKKDERTEVGDMEPEQVEIQAPEPEKPKRATRGKKRGSEAVIQEMSAMTLTDPVVDTEPSPKRRATETRRSVSPHPEDVQSSVLEDAPLEVATSPVMPKKGRKGAKKAASTRSRKASTASSAGKAAQSRIPDDSVLEAAIEADLARNMEDTEPFEFHYKDEERESARFRQQSISTSIKAPSESHYEREGTRDVQEAQEPAPEEASIIEVVPEPKQKKQPKRKAPAKKSKKEKAPGSEPELEPEPELEREPEQEEEVEHEPERELEPEPEPEPEVEEIVELVKPKPKRTSQQKRKVQEQPAEEVSQVMMEVEPVARQGSVLPVEIDMRDHQPEIDETIDKQPTKKQGKKAAKGKKPAASKRKESDIVMDEQTEPAESHEPLPEAPKPQRRGSKRESKRKSKETKDDSMIMDEQQDSEPAPTQEEIVKQPVKAKRGRPTKEAQEVSMIMDEQEDSVPAPAQEEPVKTKRGRPPKDTKEDSMVMDEQDDSAPAPAEEKPVEQPVKAKRGRPTKEAQENFEEKQVVEAKPKRGRPSKQRSIQADELPEEPKREQPSKKAQVPVKNTQRYSDLPKDRHRAQSFIESVTNSSPQRPSPNNTHSTTQERTPSPSPQASDAENQPPSTRPRSARPPILSPSKPPASRILATTTPSPLKRQEGYLTSTRSWEPMDIEELLGSFFSDKENRDFTPDQGNIKDILTSPEKKMTVEEWIYYNAKNGEERLRRECERLISIFEREGGRAMRALEGIECME